MLQDVTYDSTSGRCTSSSGNLIDGDSWTAACQKLAAEGYACGDGQGKCFSAAEEVNGWCD